MKKEKGSFEGMMREVKSTRRRRPPPSEETVLSMPAPFSSANATGEDPFHLGLDDADVKVNDESILRQDEEVQRRQRQATATMNSAEQPVYAAHAGLTTVVAEYRQAVTQGAWTRGRQCLYDFRSILEGGEKQYQYDVALEDMAAALIASVIKRGWRFILLDKKEEDQEGQEESKNPQRRRKIGMRQKSLGLQGYGGTSTTTAILEEEVMRPWRETIRTRKTLEDIHRGSAEDGVMRSGGNAEGAAFLLALQWEEKEDTDRPTEEREQRCQKGLDLLTHNKEPNFLSLYCCSMALSGIFSSSPLVLPPVALDCLIEVLALADPSWDVDGTLKRLTTYADANSSSASSLLPTGAGGLEAWEMTPPLLLPVALTARPSVVPTLTVHNDGAIIALANEIWQYTQEEASSSSGSTTASFSQSPPALSKRHEKKSLANQRRRSLNDNDEEGGNRSPSPPLHLRILQRLRQQWTSGTLPQPADNRQSQEDVATPLFITKQDKITTCRRLGRAALALLSRLQPRDVNEEVLGHALPLLFALVEEYEREDIQFLGLLIWCHAAHKTTRTALSWHFQIQMNVFLRTFKVVSHRKPRVLRPLLFVTTELLRLARPTNQQELDHWRGVLLEELLAAIPRASPFTSSASSSKEESAALFVLLEGLYRLLQVYAACQTYLLVRYLRPLTQVLAMAPLEEGDAAVRIVALRCLLLVLSECDVMVHAHAHETLAQVIRLYLSVSRQEGKVWQSPSEEETKQDKYEEVASSTRLIVDLCRQVGRLLVYTCGEKREKEMKKPAIDLAGFIRTIEAQGCPELKDFL